MHAYFSLYFLPFFEVSFLVPLTNVILKDDEGHPSNLATPNAVHKLPCLDLNEVSKVFRFCAARKSVYGEDVRQHHRLSVDTHPQQLPV